VTSGPKDIRLDLGSDAVPPFAMGLVAASALGEGDAETTMQKA